MPESNLYKIISSLATEQRNPKSENIDLESTAGILEIISNEDMAVPKAVRAELPNIERAVDIIYNAFQNGGRLFYVGAGTSGRLGVVDASECPPTFGVDPEMVQGIIAGGKAAMFASQEGAEDSPVSGAAEIVERGIKPPDVVCGLAASGRTPFVAGALMKASELGCRTILISTVPHEIINKLGTKADIKICPDVGPEVITGSTRMKSGTAQKLVLNMLTTASMVKLGKTHGNIMVDLQQTNAKLTERSRGILMALGGIGYDEAADYLDRSGGHVKTALVMILGNVSKEEAEKFINKADGKVKVAIELARIR